MDIKMFWEIASWGLGTCIMGFLFLAGWCWMLWGKIHDKVDKSWIEDQFKLRNEMFEKKFNYISNTLEEIRDSLVGDLKEKGIITLHKELEEELKKDIYEIKENCRRVHNK